jgi:hypothetical protein
MILFEPFDAKPWGRFLRAQLLTPPLDVELLAGQPDLLGDLGARRGVVTWGGNPHRFLERMGGALVPVTAFMPDAATARQEYYYHAVQNCLYKRVVTARRPTVAFWQRVL